VKNKIDVTLTKEYSVKATTDTSSDPSRVGPGKGDIIFGEYLDIVLRITGRSFVDAANQIIYIVDIDEIQFVSLTQQGLFRLSYSDYYNKANSKVLMPKSGLTDYSVETATYTESMWGVTLYPKGPIDLFNAETTGDHLGETSAYDLRLTSSAGGSLEYSVGITSEASASIGGGFKIKFKEIMEIEATFSVNVASSSTIRGTIHLEDMNNLIDCYLYSYSPFGEGSEDINLQNFVYWI